jgi:hypothetical protein
MYLDDFRTPNEEYDAIVRSYDEATSYILKFGMPKFISFDYDLGCDKNGIVLNSGYDFAKWLVDQSLDGILEFPKDFCFEVHSANPIEKNNIKSILHNYLLFKVKLI